MGNKRAATVCHTRVYTRQEAHGERDFPKLFFTLFRVMSPSLLHSSCSILFSSSSSYVLLLLPPPFPSLLLFLSSPPPPPSLSLLTSSLLTFHYVPGVSESQSGCLPLFWPAASRVVSGFFFGKRMLAVGFYDSRHIMTGVGGVPAHLGDSLQCKLADLREERGQLRADFGCKGLIALILIQLLIQMCVSAVSCKS